MDAHAMMQSQLEEQILNVAQTVEDQIDAQTRALDDMDEDDLEKLREKRMAQMRKANEQKALWRQMGHGQMNELTSEKEFFESAKKSDHMLCHFYRSTTKRCEIVDKHLAELAPKHIEARFCRINAEKSEFLVQKLLVVVLPTIALIYKGKVIDYIVGFDDIGGHDDFPTEVRASMALPTGPFFRGTASHGAVRREGSRAVRRCPMWGTIFVVSGPGNDCVRFLPIGCVQVLQWRIACQGVIKVDYDVHDGPPGDGSIKQRYGGKMVKVRNKHIPHPCLPQPLEHAVWRDWFVRGG